MKKRLIALSVILLSFSFPINSNAASKEETLEQKSKSATFYMEVRDKLKYYQSKLENKEITEKQYESKVLSNLKPLIDSDEELNALIKSEKVYNKNKQITKVSKAYFGMEAFGVKATEVALVVKHPIKGNKAKSLADKASLQSEKYYKRYALSQDNGDAFRHAYWSALMTKHIDRDFAYEMGYAHEGYKPGDKISDLDTNMDISNNYAGRKDGTKKKKSSDKNIAKYIKKSVSEGKKKRIRVKTSGKNYDKNFYSLTGVKTILKKSLVKTNKVGLK